MKAQKFFMDALNRVSDNMNDKLICLCLYLIELHLSLRQGYVFVLQQNN